MPRKSPLEYLVYALVIILSLLILGLAIISPPSFIANKSVYQGF
jgi:hypothetical protein